MVSFAQRISKLEDISNMCPLQLFHVVKWIYATMQTHSHGRPLGGGTDNLTLDLMWPPICRQFQKSESANGMCTITKIAGTFI